MTELPYRDFYYPLNVFMHILTAEEGGVTYLHYGLFDRDDDTIGAAQERSTELLLRNLPQPPAKLLEVGIGLGTTLARLVQLGYDVDGITPDDKQIAMARARYGELVRLQCVSFELFESDARYDAIVFQESSQYIDSETLFRRARGLVRSDGGVIVLDEFALRPVDTPGALHALDGFLTAAKAFGFTLLDELDLSAKAAPTVDYFNARLARYREPLIADLGLTNQQVDDLIESGRKYRDLYRNGTYGYRLLVFT